MRELNLKGEQPARPRRDVSPRTPGRAYPHLLSLVKYLETNLTDVQHFYQGGFFIGEYTKEPRYTQDVDMSILDISAYERVKEVLSAYGEQLLTEGAIGRYSIKDSASERHSGGAKYYSPDGSILFSIDIGFHEKPLETVAVDVDNIGHITITTVEQMLCDKLSAMFSDRRQRRVKDLFDAWHLLTTCEVDKEKLIICLDKRGLYPLKSEDAPFTDSRLDVMESSYNTLRIYSKRTDELISIPDFWEIVRVVGNFYSDFTDAEV